MGSLAGVQGSEGKPEQAAAGQPLPCCASWLWSHLVNSVCFLIVVRSIQLPSLLTYHLQRDPETLGVLLAPYSQHTKHWAKVNRVLESFVKTPGVQGSASGGLVRGRPLTSLAVEGALVLPFTASSPPQSKEQTHLASEPCIHVSYQTLQVLPASCHASLIEQA